MSYTPPPVLRAAIDLAAVLSLVVLSATTHERWLPVAASPPVQGFLVAFAAAVAAGLVLRRRT